MREELLLNPREEVSEDDLDEVALLDVLALGRDRDTGEDTYLCIEVSVTINVDDVERAVRRTSIIRAMGHPAVAVVGGERITEAARIAAVENEATIDIRIAP